MAVHPKESLPEFPAAYDWESMRENGYKTVDFIVDYHRSLAQREVPVQAQVSPNFLREKLQSEGKDKLPIEASPWADVLQDVQSNILPGITHWQHPDFFAFFPAMVSPPALMGEMLGNAFNQPGFNWMCSPSASELEGIVMNWLAEALGLPKEMFWAPDSNGGGVVQASATEAMIVVVLAAKNKKIEEEKAKGNVDTAAIAGKLVCYHSDQSHFAIVKAARVLGVHHIRSVKSTIDATTGNAAMTAEALEEAVVRDLREGLLPFLVSANFGATGTCAIDPLEKIAVVARRHGIWFNVDAAYAGAALMCSEMRPLAAGVDLCDTLQVNGSKWFSMLFNASFMFFRERQFIVSSLNATGVYLDNKETAAGKVIDLKDYHLGLGRPFRSLKVYCSLRAFGIDGLRSTLRRHMILAKYLAGRLSGSALFEVPVATQFGLVCFRLREGGDEDNKAFLEKVNASKKAFMVHAMWNERVILRVSLAYPRLEFEDLDKLFDLFVQTATLRC